LRGGWLPAVLLAFAAFACVYALLSDQPAHRVWGLWAAGGYAAGAVLWACRARRAALAALVVGCVAGPLAFEAFHGIANPEIPILREAAARWLAQGTPFPTAQDLAGHAMQTDAYNVYLPLLSLFGMPSALAGGGALTDPRIYLALVSGALLCTLGVRDRTPALLLITCPWVALELVAGSTDVVVIGVVCLGFVLTGRERFAAGGVAIGAAAALKALAWPAVVVAGFLAYTRGGTRGRGQNVGALVCVLALVLGPPALAAPHAFLTNAIELPLGLLPVKLAAASPLPGHLLATAGPIGRVLVLVLLGAAAVAILAGMLRRPPCDAASAGRWMALGITVAVLLAPSSRYGYAVYPICLLELPLLMGRNRISSPGRAWPRAGSAAGSTTPITG
jgi:hypothetical protein